MRRQRRYHQRTGNYCERAHDMPGSMLRWFGERDGTAVDVRVV
jgi:hypothetical protein